MQDLRTLPTLYNYGKLETFIHTVMRAVIEKATQTLYR